MAANKSQGSFYTSVFGGVRPSSAPGLLLLDRGMGKLLLLVGAVGLIGSLFGMLRIKSLEGKTALKSSPLAMKLVGAGCSALGWVITLVRHAPDPERRRAHRPRAGRNRRKSFRDHRRFASSLQ